MFCDSLLEDADWLRRYARGAAGEEIPDALIRARIESRQPFMAFEERMLALVSRFESALYGMSEEQRTPDAVLRLARDTELRVLDVHSPRPVLAIPHLLNQESSASYHGYLLAHMAVYQTRAWFEGEFGVLTDNPRIGPLLAQHYWTPGNSMDHDATLMSLTGKGFSAQYLADECNRSVEDAWKNAETTIATSAGRPVPADAPASLDAAIRVVHGTEVLADNADSDDEMCTRFERWVEQHYPPRA
jgi:hypothetical protein